MMPLYLNGNIKNKLTADLCAAPGGKTFQMLANGAKVVAIEKNKNRAKLIQENFKRLNFDCKLKIQGPIS